MFWSDHSFAHFATRSILVEMAGLVIKQRDTNITVEDKRNSIKSAKVFPLALIYNKKAKMHSEGK